MKLVLAVVDGMKPAMVRRAVETGHAPVMAKVMEAKSPLERLDAHIGILDERLTSLKDLKGAVSALYATLTDEQKKKADTALNGIGCMM